MERQQRLIIAKFRSAFFMDIQMSTQLIKTSALNELLAKCRAVIDLSNVKGNIPWFTFNLNFNGNFSESIRVCTYIRNCEILWETHFQVYFNLVYNSSASLVIASQGGSYKPGAWKNYREWNMSFIFWPEGQRVNL